jgi:hypothetical protein
MSIEIFNTSSKRKSLKARRIKGHQRLFVDKAPADLDPDSVLVNRILNNIKKEMRKK